MKAVRTMVRFIHMADMQLGMRAHDATEVGERLRDARFETLKRIMALAQTEEVDFVIIAGDLFENNQVSAHTVSRAVQILQETESTPVYVLPGNHDWLDAGSVYERPEFTVDAARNIVVLREPEPVEAGESCVLYPCPLTRRWDLADPTDWIPGREDDRLIRIGVAHGSLPIPGEEREFPIEVDTPQKKGLDYLALGDWHSLGVYEGGLLAYPGTPERTSFGERDAGHVLVGEIEKAGHPPDLSPHEVGELTWEHWEEELGEPAHEGLQSLRERIEGLPDGSNTLLRLTLRGAVGSHELPLVDQFDTWLEARCANKQLLYSDLRTQLRTTEALQGALRDLAESDGVVAGVVADLRAMAAVGVGTAPEAVHVQSREMDQLINTWVATQGEGQEMSVVAVEALKLLAQLAGEVS